MAVVGLCSTMLISGFAAGVGKLGATAGFSVGIGGGELSFSFPSRFDLLDRLWCFPTDMLGI